MSMPRIPIAKELHDDDISALVAFAIMAVVIAACVLALCGCSAKAVPTDRAHGMPLDACEVVEYDRPLWLSDCEHAYKVYDRITGDAWWLLDMGLDRNAHEYVVLPLGKEDR